MQNQMTHTTRLDSGTKRVLIAAIAALGVIEAPWRSPRWVEALRIKGFELPAVGEQFIAMPADTERARAILNREAEAAGRRAPFDTIETVAARVNDTATTDVRRAIMLFRELERVPLALIELLEPGHGGWDAVHHLRACGLELPIVDKVVAPTPRDREILAEARHLDRPSDA